LFIPISINPPMRKLLQVTKTWGEPGNHESVHSGKPEDALVEVMTYPICATRDGIDPMLPTGALGHLLGRVGEGGEEFVAKVEGESGHVVLSEYLDSFENAAKELERSVKDNNHRALLTALSDGVASIEGYINYQAGRKGGQQYSDSKQQMVSFETKIDEWIPQITGSKLDKGGVNWNHHNQLRNIRDDFQAHPKTHLYLTPYSEICRRMNLFRTGIAGLLFDLHVQFKDLVPAQIIHGYFLPEIQYVIEPAFLQPEPNQS
jgi:hypothetical protein